MVVDEDISIISFYMRDARYGRFCGGEVYPKFIPMEYKFQDFGKMSHKIPDYIMKLRIMNQLSDVMLELNKFHKTYFKTHRLVNYILCLIGLLFWFCGAYLANIGITKENYPVLGHVMDSHNTTTNGTTPEPGSTTNGTTPESATNGTNHKPAFKIGEMEVYKPEFFIPGAILAGLGGLTLLAYLIKHCIQMEYFQNSVHDKCEQVIKEFNERGMDSGLYLEYEKDFNANFQELKSERESSNNSSHISYRYVRTTPYVPGFNVKMDVAKREAGNGFETFDPMLIKNHKWQQNYTILDEDFLVHMTSGYVAKPNLDYPTQNVSVIDETLKPSPWSMNNNNKISSATLYI